MNEGYIRRSDLDTAMKEWWANDNDSRSFAEVVNGVPAADVEPVVHGYWYLRGGRPCCSVCNTKALWKDEGGTGGFSHEYVGAKSKRCPECGARMDKEDSDAKIH